MLCAGVLGLSKLMNSIADNISAVQQRVQHALRGAGRNSDSVQLLAVSKTQPVAAIRAAERAGLKAFGENYLQEAEQKIASCSRLARHCSGTLSARCKLTRPAAPPNCLTGCTASTASRSLNGSPPSAPLRWRR